MCHCPYVTAAAPSLVCAIDSTAACLLLGSCIGAVCSNSRADVARAAGSSASLRRFVSIRLQVQVPHFVRKGDAQIVCWWLAGEAEQGSRGHGHQTAD